MLKYDQKNCIKLTILYTVLSYIEQIKKFKVFSKKNLRTMVVFFVSITMLVE